MSCGTDEPTVNEGSGCLVSWSVTKPTGDTATVSSVSYRIDDLETRSSILVDTPVGSPALTGSIQVTAAQNRIIDDNRRVEKHVLTVTVAFSSGEPATKAIKFGVLNLRFKS